MTMCAKKIESLRKAFAISLIAFEIQHNISVMFGYTGDKSYMHHLQIVANKELSKYNPDMNNIYTLLAMMEDEVKRIVTIKQIATSQ